MGAITDSISESFSNAITIQEDSNFLKVISYIPILGLVPAIFQEISLANKINQTQDPARLIELINLKNQYKVANAVRNFSATVLIVAGIALGILWGPLGIILTVAQTGLAMLQINHINQNNQIINELQTTGFRPGILVK